MEAREQDACNSSQTRATKGDVIHRLNCHSTPARTYVERPDYVAAAHRPSNDGAGDPKSKTRRVRAKRHSSSCTRGEAVGG